MLTQQIEDHYKHYGRIGRSLTKYTSKLKYHVDRLRVIVITIMFYLNMYVVIMYCILLKNILFQFVVMR